MAESFATPTFQRVLQQAHRETELAPPTFDPPLPRPNSVRGQRLVELLQGLGEQTPLVHENDDRLNPHGR